MTRNLLHALSVALLLGACGRHAVGPHGGPIARATLSRPGFAWRTARAPGVHVHYLPGSYAAAHAHDLARAAAASLARDLAFGQLRAPGEPVELFLSSSRGQQRQLTGLAVTGHAEAGELTAFVVVAPGWPPPFSHEIMHALTLKLWGLPPGGPWISEGVATWAAGPCQGHTADAIAAGFLRDGTLPPLRDLAARFRRFDEMHGYVTAASAVAFVARSGGPAAVRARWQARPSPGAHPLGADGDAVEAAWRRHLASVRPARFDVARLRRHGCEIT
jgi:hypothetical protein